MTKTKTMKPKILSAEYRREIEQFLSHNPEGLDPSFAAHQYMGLLIDTGDIPLMKLMWALHKSELDLGCLEQYIMNAIRRGCFPTGKFLFETMDLKMDLGFDNEVIMAIYNNATRGNTEFAKYVATKVDVDFDTVIKVCAEMR